MRPKENKHASSVAMTPIRSLVYNKIENINDMQVNMNLNDQAATILKDYLKFALDVRAMIDKNVNK